MSRAKRATMQKITPTEPETVADRYPFKYQLDSGDRGPLVLWTQSKLAERGHYTGELTGRYDRATSVAVRQFQASAGIAVTGVVDRKTWNAL